MWPFSKKPSMASHGFRNDNSGNLQFELTAEESDAVQRTLSQFKGYAFHPDIVEEFKRVLTAQGLRYYGEDQMLLSKEKGKAAIDKAVAAFGKAYSIDQTPLYMYFFAVAVDSAGRKNEAMELFQKFLAAQERFVPTKLQEMANTDVNAAELVKNARQYLSAAGNRQRQEGTTVFRRLGTLVDVAQLITYTLIKRSMSTLPMLYDTSLMSAAVTNYLYGRDMIESHREAFGEESIRGVAFGYLNEDKALCELVVQSLRMRGVIEYAGTGIGKTYGEFVLQMIGDQFPKSPDPDSYTQLVEDSLGKLSREDQEQCASFALSHGVTLATDSSRR